jgi:hypothetical protein
LKKNYQKIRSLMPNQDMKMRMKRDEEEEERLRPTSSLD